MMKSISGLSLSELLIATFISSLLFAALSHQYGICKRYYQSIQARIEQETELQFVMELMQQSIRKSGFTPCLSLRYLESIDKRTNTGSLSSIFMDAERHSLTIHRMSEVFERVQRIETPTELLTTYHQPLNTKHPLIIADCYHAEIQTAELLKTNAASQRIKLSQPLSHAYIPPLYVGEWIEEKYWMRTSPHRGVMYQTEELSQLITDMKFVLLSKTLLRVSLGLSNQQLLTFDTHFRA